MSERRTNIGVALAVIGLGVFGLVYLVPVHVGKLTSAPALLPVLGFSALLLLGVGLLAATLRAHEEDPGEAAHGSDGASEAVETVPLAPIVITLAIYAWLLGSLGFLLASALGLFVFLLLYRVRSPPPLLLVTGGTIAAIYFGIERMLGTPLPSGDFLKAILP